MPPFLVKMPQSTMVGVQYPKSVYSRVIGFCFPVPAPGPNDAFMVTPPLGQTIWLLRVQLWFTSETPGTSILFNWRVATCTVVPTAAGAVAVDLEPVIPFECAGKPFGFWYGDKADFDFSMSRLYVGTARRFAVYAQNNHATENLWVQAAFTISEG